MKLLMNEKGSKNWSLFSSYPNIVPIVFFTSSHSQLGCNKFSSWVTTHTRKRGTSLIIIEGGIPMPLPSLDKGDVPVYGICLYMFQLIY